MSDIDKFPKIDKDDSLNLVLEKIDSIEDGVVVKLAGYIDTYNASYFQKQIGKIVEANFVNIIFDCSQLSYVSSTGIGSFTTFLKLIKPKGGDIVLLSIQPRVYEVFQLLGFSQFFAIREKIEDAIKYLKGEEISNVAVFPSVFSCPVCQRRLKATRSGRFRCSDCKSILAIDQNGQVFLG